MANPIIVVEYDCNWPAQFESLRLRIAGALGDLAQTIEHVGSTAVPDLAAKPIIDIDVLLKMGVELPVAVHRLERLGYINRGDLGVPGREAFRTPDHDLPHHLYVCPHNSPAFRAHIAFRNYLRAHPEAAEEYASLKKSLAQRFRDDREAYVMGKSEFVAAILNLAAPTTACP